VYGARPAASGAGSSCRQGLDVKGSGGYWQLAAGCCALRRACALPPLQARGGSCACEPHHRVLHGLLEVAERLGRPAGRLHHVHDQPAAPPPPAGRASAGRQSQGPARVAGASAGRQRPLRCSSHRQLMLAHGSPPASCQIASMQDPGGPRHLAAFGSGVPSEAPGGRPGAAPPTPP
jgi:hypothetical protein